MRNVELFCLGLLYRYLSILISQNDLTEYFSLLSFVIPDVLGSEAEFRKRIDKFIPEFEIPILKGRDSEASELDRANSETKLHEMLEIANKFIIRRTAELLTKYCKTISDLVPVKYEYVVFCRMTAMQEEIYRFYAAKETKRLLATEDGVAVIKEKGGGQTCLKSITRLKKVFSLNLAG